MMDNLVTFAAIAGPLAVFIIVVSGVEMYIERRGHNRHLDHHNPHHSTTPVHAHQRASGRRDSVPRALAQRKKIGLTWR
ncbi:MULTISPECIES: hypothetical protein [Anaerotruncus]|uniref:Uncharacterized protein n=1 Tax=Anaerotruncus massiliensis (ex Togo et al. 2019) TaxID=1673720 RepID=A0ABR7ADR0_9FIRM|nr:MULTISPECIES: hypothetical protein [Anaerotruncus]MBC3938546.1 hypothetical protein [Anaerotruncus massiliensis (ex Togo et al. 2019)]